MKTDDLVSLLASDVTPVDARARRVAYAVVAGLAGAAALMAAILGPNPVLEDAAASPMFWLRVGFAAAVLAASVPAFRRAGTPGARAGIVPVATAAPFVALWVIAAIVLARAAPGERLEIVMGDTWRSCPYHIALLSLPGFVAALWAMKACAPTRLRLAGATAGLVSAAIGALVYAFHCPELAPPFVAVWYVLGMLLPTLAGALVGPRVLRW